MTGFLILAAVVALVLAALAVVTWLGGLATTGFLTWMSVITVLLLVIGLAASLIAIWLALRSIERSLAKVNMGVRAIDTQTQPLGRHVGAINDGLGQLAGGLKSVETHLRSTASALGGDGK